MIQSHYLSWECNPSFYVLGSQFAEQTDYL
jgi:hypothetical protein